MKSVLFQSVLLLCCLTASPKIQAQFPVVATSPEPVSRLSTLSSGHKFISAWNSLSGTRTIYNPDFSVHRVLNFPPLPNPFGAEVRMSNITDELFDTDPSTIEFAIGSVSDPSVGVRVFREDGTEIFNQTPGLGMFGDGGVYENNGVAYMLLYESQVDGPYKVYQLPGHLPCIDCHGTPAGMVVMNGDDASGGLTIFPNPTANEVTVQVPGHFAQNEAKLLLMSSDGKVVRQYMLNGKSAFTFSVEGLAGGVYQCILVVDNLRTSGKLVIGSR